MSEKFVRKFGATSCVFRASMREPTEIATTDFNIRDILSELDTLFTDAIEQVNIVFVKCCNFNIIEMKLFVLVLLNVSFLYRKIS